MIGKKYKYYEENRDKELYWWKSFILLYNNTFLWINENGNYDVAPIRQRYLIKKE